MFPRRHHAESLALQEAIQRANSRISEFDHTEGSWGELARPGMPASSLFHKFSLELHGAKPINFAVDVVVAVDQAYVFHFGAHFDHGA